VSPACGTCIRIGIHPKKLRYFHLKYILLQYFYNAKKIRIWTRVNFDRSRQAIWPKYFVSWALLSFSWSSLFAFRWMNKELSEFKVNSNDCKLKLSNINTRRVQDYRRNAERDKSVENRKISCIIENMGFAIKCAVLCYLWVTNCVRITYDEVSVLVEKLTINFYRLNWRLKYIGCKYRFVGFSGNLRNEPTRTLRTGSAWKTTQCWNIHFNTCLYTRQPGTVFKILATPQS